jgi:DNA-3-methyladenine glycosylase
MISLGPDFFNRDTVAVARDLIGAHFYVHEVGGIIVETEAYHHTEPAAHSFIGKTARNTPMFGASGTAYIYRSYGLHWCFNIVCEPGCAVLIRAIEPLQGIEVMSGRRQGAQLKYLCSGPGRLCQALSIDNSYSGAAVTRAPFSLQKLETEVGIVVGKRIGISKAADLPWRFGLENSAFLSKTI